MYKRIIRPLLFRLSPELIHRIMVGVMRLLSCRGARSIARGMFSIADPSLEREVLGIRFPNPIGLAAGFDKNAECYRMLGALGFGFVEVGTITPRPQPGNPRPRLFRLPKDGAMINRMGFNNAGVERAARNLQRRSRHRCQIVGVNLGKNSLTPNQEAAADYLAVFRRLYEYADYFVVNVSCPNVAQLTALQNKEKTLEIITALIDFRRGQNDYRPILLKISPDLTREQVDEMIDVVVESGLDGIVATNTTTSRMGLKSDSKTIQSIGNGGLSGAPLRERAIEMVRYIHSRTEGRYPIIGVGGIMSPQDALDMLDAGASLVQVYTGFIYEGPTFVKHICKALKK